MDVREGETVYFDFTTHNPNTGQVADADSTPTSEVFQNATDVAIATPTCTKRTGKTGNYRLPITFTPATYSWGNCFNVVVSATVGGIGAKTVIATIIVLPERHKGTVVADVGNLATTFKTNLTDAVNDWWKDAYLMFTGNSTLAGQIKKITAYTGATKFVTVNAFTAAPTALDEFIIVNL